MTLRLGATGCHLPHWIAQCYLTQVNTPNRLVLDLPTPDGWKA